MSADPYAVRVIGTQHIPVFDRNSNAHNVTQVRIMVGDNGPFVQNFGPGQDYPDTAEAINQWKDKVKAKLMAIGATT